MTNCKYCKADCARRGEDREKECRGYIPMTNADHIRAMSNQELSEFLSKPWCDNHRLKEDCSRFDADCVACASDWLNQPHEEDT